MKKLILFVTALLVCISLSFSQNNNDTLFTKVGHQIMMESKILNQTKKVFVHLPFRFDVNKEYPLIVLSDFMAFKPLASITEIMAYNETIPPCIVVCPMTTNPRVDYSPIINDSSETVNGGKTIAFFEKELIPFLESRYRISKKIIWGQSYSGMFTTFVLLTNPTLFDAYISDLPKLEIIKEEIENNSSLMNMEGKEVFYQLSWSTLKEHTPELKNLTEKLKSNSSGKLNWTYTEESDSVFITHILTNYTYALHCFFKNE